MENNDRALREPHQNSERVSRWRLRALVQLGHWPNRDVPAWRAACANPDPVVSSHTPAADCIVCKVVWLLLGFVVGWTLLMCSTNALAEDAAALLARHQWRPAVSLTRIPCPDNAGQIAYATTRAGLDMGCYFIQEKSVIVYWSGGRESEYGFDTVGIK